MFVLKVFATEIDYLRGFLLVGLIATFYFTLQKIFLPEVQKITSRLQKPKPTLPLSMFLDEWTVAFLVVMITLQIQWCIHHDLSQLGMRPFYPIVLVMIFSIIWFLYKNSKLQMGSFWKKALLCLGIIFGNVSQLYSLNLSFLEIRNQFSFDNQFYRSLFGAYFVQTAFGDMQQDAEATKKFNDLPAATLDYNILVIINDSQRWDHLSSNGNPEQTDEELSWFLQKSFSYQFPVSPANFTDTSMPALLSGLASDQDVRKIKSSLTLVDYFAKGANTFFVSAQDITWSKLDRLYKSVGQKHIWDWTKQVGFTGNPENTNDRPSMEYLRAYLPQRTPYVGIWQTFASHAPYTTDPEFQIFKPCDVTRKLGRDGFRNCYLNAQVFSSHLRSELLKTVDLQKTIVVMTSDHGEGMNEHGVWYHGVDYHQEMVKVPFILYIPPQILGKIPKENQQNLLDNVGKITSTTDLVPTLLHLHELYTGQKLYSNLNEYSGKSLLTHWDYRVVYSSHCFPQYRCYSREIMFADDDYYVLFRPSEGFYKIYSTWKDLKQEHPLELKDVDPKKLKRLVDEAASIHSSGLSMKAYYEKLKH